MVMCLYDECPGIDKLMVELREVQQDRDRIATAAYGDAAIVQGLREELESCRQEKSSAYAAGELFGIGQATKLAVEQEMGEARATIERLEALVLHDNDCNSAWCTVCDLSMWAEGIGPRAVYRCASECEARSCNCTRPERIVGAKGEPK